MIEFFERIDHGDDEDAGQGQRYGQSEQSSRGEEGVEPRKWLRLRLRQQR